MQTAADVVDTFDAQAALAATFGIAQPTKARDAAEQRLADRPTLWPAAQPWWDGWWVLHAGRQYAGMGGTPVGLSYREMTAYAADAGLPRVTSVALWQAMDAEFSAVMDERDQQAKARETDDQRTPPSP